MLFQIFLGHTASVTRVKLQQVARIEMVAALEVALAIRVPLADALPLSTRLGRSASWLYAASVFAVKARTFATASLFSTDKASLAVRVTVACSFPLLTRIWNGAAVVGSNTLERPICRFSKRVLLQQPAGGLPIVVASLHLSLSDLVKSALGLYPSPLVAWLEAFLQLITMQFAPCDFSI